MTMHALPLLRLHVLFLQGALSSDGWATTSQNLIAASHILDLPEFQGHAVIPPAEPEQTAFLTEPMPLALTERQREAVKTCVRHVMGKGQLRPNKYLPILLEAIGLSE